MKLTAKANTICLWEILREYSDCDHMLRMGDIIRLMKRDYDLSVDRRTVYSCVAVLTEMGYDISAPDENGYGYYLASREFDASEIRLLMDSVYGNPGIAQAHSAQLIQKLQKLLPAGKRRRYRNLSIANAGRKTDNKEVFLNIEYLDEAITKRQKVAFTYMQYGFDKKLRPRRKEKYVVSPYEMVAANERYYLLCKCDSHQDAVSQFRIDKIKGIALAQGSYVPAPRDFSPRQYRDRSIFMYGGPVGRAVFRCRNRMLEQVIDFFGKDAQITPNSDGETFTLTVAGSLEGLGYWAGHYIDACEALEPPQLRQSVMQMIKNNVYGL